MNVVASIVMLLAGSLFCVTYFPNVQAVTHFVGGGGAGNFTTIQDAVDAANPGDIVYVYGGTYYENLVVTESLSLVGESRETTAIDGSHVSDTVLLAADWINVTGFSIRGGGGFGWLSAGIRVSGARDIQLKHNNISDSEYGIVLDSSQSVVLTDNQMVNDGIHIWGDLIQHWNTHTIDTSNTVNGKSVHYWKDAVGGNVPPDAGQVIIANCTNVSIENQVISSTSVGIELGHSSKSRVVNNSISLNHKFGLFMSNSRNSEIESNNFISNGLHGIWLYDADNNSLEQNNVSSNNMSGIYSWNSDGNRIVQNVVAGNQEGIVLDAGSDRNTLSHNNATGNDQFGILIEGSSRNAIADNTITLNNRSGIQIFQADDNTAVNNVLKLNGQYGLAVQFSEGNTLATNNLINNSWSGMKLESSPGNKVFGNNFVDNAQQASESAGGSLWHNGYPQGGNYWNDYTGIDQKSGPNQDEAGPDGIGDTPYAVVGGFSEDPYPLMGPAEPLQPPTPPLNLTAAPEDEKATLSWSAPASDGGLLVLNYVVYRGTELETQYRLLEVGDDLIYMDTGLVNGQTYYYRVAAKNAVGEGPRSVAVSATPSDLVGNVPPMCNITSPDSQSKVAGQVIVRGSATDSDGVVEFVQIRVDSESWRQANGTTVWEYSWDSTTVLDGEHVIGARSFDGLNYSSVSMVTVIVDNPEPQGLPLWEILFVLLLVAVVALVTLALYRRRRRDKDKQGQT